MAMQGMDTDLHYGFVLPTMALRSCSPAKPPATTAIAGSCLTRSSESEPSDGS